MITGAGGMEGLWAVLGSCSLLEPGPGKALWHRGAGTQDLQIPPAEPDEGLSHVPNREMGGSVPTSVPTHSQPTTVLGVCKGGLDRPCPGGFWAPPGQGGKHTQWS